MTRRFPLAGGGPFAGGAALLGTSAVHAEGPLAMPESGGSGGTEAPPQAAATESMPNATMCLTC